MAVEIERKYLVKEDLWNALDKGKGIYYKQGYLCTDPENTVRVRISERSAYLTIKSASKGVSRLEFEYPIPLADAEEILDQMAASSVAKVRYEISFGGKTWEVDEFQEENEGLVVAEIELDFEAETFELPEWVAEEVTSDQRYYNSQLSLNPYSRWKDEIQSA